MEEVINNKAALAAICRQSSSKADLLNLMSVNRVFREVASSEHVWDRLCAQDFPYYHDRLISGDGRAGGGNSSGIRWYTEYRKRHHRERCWHTGTLTRKAPVVLSGHLGCVFGACFLGAPFAPGTICTGAHISAGGVQNGEGRCGSSSGGEIKMWLPNRGTTMEQVVREFGPDAADGEERGVERIPEGMDVETFTKREIAKAVRLFDAWFHGWFRFLKRLMGD